MRTYIHNTLLAIACCVLLPHASFGQYAPPRYMAAPIDQPAALGQPGMMPGPQWMGAPMGPMSAPIGTGVAPIGAFAPAGPGVIPVGAVSCTAPGPGCDAPAGGCQCGAGLDCTSAASCGGMCGSGGCQCSKVCYSVAVFGEFLYLRARDAEVAYATITNAAVAPPGVPIQVAPLGMVDPDFQPGFRGGVTARTGAYSTLTAQYTMFESDTADSLGPAPPGRSIQGLIFHPQTAQAAASGTGPATADYRISFDLIDLEYRRLIRSSCNHQLNLLLGVRYGSLEQEFRGSVPVLGQDTVVTDIDFEGIGARLGLEYDRKLRRGLSVYGKLHGSLLAGEWTADYDQGQNFDNSVVDTSWEAGRITPVIDFELGMGWTSESGFWKFQAGYLYSGWFNGVNTDNWIKAVQGNNFVDIGDRITFDGLTARVETRF